MKIRKEGS